MIISHKYRFIFIKTRKTAGTSVEIALSRLCGEDDVLTPLLPEDEQIRFDYTGGTGARNWQLPESASGRTRRAARFYPHMPAREIAELVPESVWKSYYKFAIERNSFAKVLSGFHWYISRQPNTPKFSRFVNSRRVERLSDFSLYAMEDSGIVVDRIVQFDELLPGFNSVLDEIGLPGVTELPRAKVSRSEKYARSGLELYSPALVDRVSSVFHREIAEFGYTMDNAARKVPS
jgi:hypothetical protein